MTRHAHTADSGRYSRTAIALHWLIALLLLGQMAFGWSLDDIPRNTPARAYWINLHKSVGLLIGLLVALRIGWRWRHAPPPALPMPAWQAFAARCSHFALYACMVAMPLSGYLASNFSRHGIKLFNTIRLAPWGSDDKLLYAVFNQTHNVSAVVLAVLVAIHLLAVLKHTLIDHDRLLARMWPAHRREERHVVDQTLP